MNLRELESEKSHNLWIPIRDRVEGAGRRILNIEREGEINLLITISGLTERMEERIVDQEMLGQRFVSKR